MAVATSRLPELSLRLALAAGAPGLLLLFIALATPERIKSGIDGARGGVDEASVPGVVAGAEESHAFD
jgi:hypothetical protein